MYLLILESLGTQELILIALVALIFLGPRRLPEIARKIGKIMADLKSTSSEFRQTWEKEVDFEEETKALRLDSIEAESEQTISRKKEPLSLDQPVAEPAIREIDKEQFDRVSAESRTAKVGELKEIEENRVPEAETWEDDSIDQGAIPDMLSDKRNWL